MGDKAGSDVGINSVIGGAGGNGIGPGEAWSKRCMRRREGLRGHQHRHPPACRLMREGTVRRECGCWSGKQVPYRDAAGRLPVAARVSVRQSMNLSEHMYVSTYPVVGKTCESWTRRSAPSACIDGVAIRYQKPHHDDS